MDNKRFLHIIDWLRFPLIVGILFIHNNSFSQHLPSDSWGSYVVELFSQGISRIAVPVFFFISGYLFFHKTGSFNRNIYFQKLKRRSRSLLIPYIAWNILAILYLVASAVLLDKSGSQGEPAMSYLLRSVTYQPAAYQMWFVRDLLCMVILSPLIYFLCKRIGLVYVAATALLWIADLKIPVIGEYGFSMTAIFGFSLGGYLSMHSLEPLALMRRLRPAAYCYPVLLALDISLGSVVIHNLAIVAGAILCFMLCDYMFERRLLKPMPLLASASFFVFAIHEPVILCLYRKIMLASPLAGNTAMIVAFYFLSVMLTAVTCVVIYLLAGRFFPRLTQLLTGGRSTK